MLVTSEHESTAHYQKENLTQVARAQNPNCSLLFPLTLAQSIQSDLGMGTGSLSPSLPPHFSLSSQSAQCLFYFLRNAL